MFLTSTAKSLLNATLLVCVFMFGMQSTPATAKSLCTSLDEHKYAFKLDCTGNGAYTPMFRMAGSCFTSTRSSGGASTDSDLCVRYNPNVYRTVDGTSINAYCPTGSRERGTGDGSCVCEQGTNWSTANQKCK